MLTRAMTFKFSWLFLLFIIMNFRAALIVDTVTGTVVNLSNCVILQETDLTSSEWDEFASMSDSEICEISEERGQSLLSLLTSFNQTK